MKNQLQTRCQAACRNEIRRARGTLYTLRLTTSSRIIILGRYSTTTMKYETWVAEIFQEVLLSIKQQGSSSQALHPRDAPFSKGPPYPYPLSLRSAILSPTCVPDVCAWLSCLARALRPWKFIGKTRRDRSRIHQGDDLTRRAEISYISASRGCLGIVVPLVPTSYLFETKKINPSFSCLSRLNNGTYFVCNKVSLGNWFDKNNRYKHKHGYTFM